MEAAGRSLSGRILTKKLLLRCHTLLGLRWCFLPLTVLLLSGSVLVACQLGGQFAAWSLALLLADSSHAGISSTSAKATILLTLTLALSGAALYCLPLMNVQALAAMIIYLALAAALSTCRCRVTEIWKPRAAVLHGTIYAAWTIGEALLGVAVSAGLLYAGSTLLADERGRIERQWLFFWRLLCVNCALSIFSLIMLPLLLLRLFRPKGEVEHHEPTVVDLQVIGACTDELPEVQPRRGWRFEPPKRVVRSLYLGSAATCVACMVLCTAVFLSFHVVVPGQSLSSLGTTKNETCHSCFCAGASPDFTVQRGVKYGSAFSELHGRQEDLFLDVYRPAVQQPLAPAVLLIHGGNFIGDSRNSALMESEASYFARAGYVAFNMDYRLDGSTYLVQVAAVRDAVHDAKAAVRYIVEHAATFGVDPHRIAAWGESAGGITAASLNALASEGSSGNPGARSNVSAAVSISGTMWPFLVAAPRNHPRDVAPWFDVHGTKDSTVFAFLAVMTHVYLMARGLPETQNRLVWVPGDYHVPWGPYAPLDLSASLRPVVLNFLSEVMKLPGLCH